MAGPSCFCRLSQASSRLFKSRRIRARMYSARKLPDVESGVRRTRSKKRSPSSTRRDPARPFSQQCKCIKKGYKHDGKSRVQEHIIDLSCRGQRGYLAKHIVRGVACVTNVALARSRSSSVQAASRLKVYFGSDSCRWPSPAASSRRLRAWSETKPTWTSSSLTMRQRTIRAKSSSNTCMSIKTSGCFEAKPIPAPGRPQQGARACR